MSKTINLPGWMIKFHAEHGIWPIAGGSANDPPPAGGEGGGSSITVEGDPPPPSGENPGETPPSRPASTSTVDPGSFNRGAQDPPGTQNSPQVPDPNANRGGRVFTQEEVERIRQEEKDKLYGKITSVEEELRTLREEREADEKRRQKEEEAEAQKAKEAEEQDLDAKQLLERKLTEKEEEWTRKFNDVQNQIQERDALLEKERQFNALQEYKRNQIEAHEDDIMPHLRDIIDGNTEEEIQQSINRAIEKTTAIMGDFQSAQQAQRQQIPGPRVTQPGDGGPMEQVEGSTRTYTPEEINSMSMAEYAKVRDKLLPAAGRQGPYGG